MADMEKKVAEEKAPKAAKPKKEKVPFGQRVKNFFKSYKSEFKKIVWASPKSVLNNTVIVVVSIIVCSAAIGIFDYVFSTAIIALANWL